MENTNKIVNIYLVRHGESEGNIDRLLYQQMADHAICITKRGEGQALKAGHSIGALINNDKTPSQILVLNSSYYRTRQTSDFVIEGMGQRLKGLRERLVRIDTPLVREQKAGIYDGYYKDDYKGADAQANADYQKHMGFNGRFYAKTPLGDSRDEIFDRVGQAMQIMLGDCSDQGIRHAVVVLHGVSILAATAWLMRYTPEWMDAEKTPDNCWVRALVGAKKEHDINYRFKDMGYVWGEGAPLLQPRELQIPQPCAENTYMPDLLDANIIVPARVKVTPLRLS